jgi:hypothetical protein
MNQNLPRLLENRLRLPQLAPRLELIILGSTAALAVFSAALMPYRNESLAARILEFTGYSVGFISAIGCARKIETPEKRERERQQRLNDIEQREAALREREADLEKRKFEVLSEMQQRQQQFEAANAERWERQQQFYEQAIAQLRQQVAIANAPKFDPGARNQNANANKVIQYLWRQHEVTLDHKETLFDPVEKVEKYIVELRNPADIRKLRDEKLLMELEALLNADSQGLIEVAQLGVSVVISYRIGRDSRETQLKKREAQRASMFTIEQTVSRSLGYFIAGESGSGKTAIASYLASCLANKTPTQQEKKVLKSESGAEGIVLDIHNNAVWREVGLPVIFKPLEVLDYILLIRKEYEERKAGKKGNRVIIFVDEFEELINEVEASFDEAKEGKHAAKTIADTVRMLGSGGRKFALNIIVMNQSWNCTAIKLDGNHRNNFVGIALNANADNYVQQKCGANTFESLREWLFVERKDRYRAITFGAVSPRPLLHPTHHDYKTIEDGQPPMNLKPIEWLPLAIGDNNNYEHHWETEIDFQASPQSSPHHPHGETGEDVWRKLERLYNLDCAVSPQSETPPNNPIFESFPASPHCPQCRSTQLWKNGNRGDKQRWKCKDCKHSFTEP